MSIKVNLLRLKIDVLGLLESYRVVAARGAGAIASPNNFSPAISEHTFGVLLRPLALLYRIMLPPSTPVATALS